MRKKHFLLLFLCGFLFYHCYDSHHIGEPIKQESDDSPIMNEAKSILSGCDNSVVLTNLKGNEHSRIESRGFGSPTTGTPIWEKAVELQNGDEEVLLVPLQEEQTRYTHTCIVRGNVDSRQIASSFSQLMIKKKNNRTIAHVITYLPERKYLRKNSLLSDSLIYNPTRFNFEGIVLISSLKGTFKHGYLYEKGIPVIKLFKRHEHTDNCSHHSHEAEVRENVNFNIFFYTKSLQSRSYGTNEETELFCSTCFKPVDECTCYLIEGEYIYCNVCGERSYECVCDLYRCDFCGKYPCVCGEAPELCPACLNYPCTCYDDEACMYCGKDPCVCQTNPNTDGNSNTTGITAADIIQATKNSVEKVKQKFGDTKAYCNQGVNFAFQELFGSTVLSNMNANTMVRYWISSPDWIEITLSESQSYANNGHFTVAGWINTTGKSGHVVVIVPGETQPGWGTQVPCAMDTGYKMRTSKQKLSLSFGKDKKDSIHYFIYK